MSPDSFYHLLSFGHFAHSDSDLATYIVQASLNLILMTIIHLMVTVV